MNSAGRSATGRRDPASPERPCSPAEKHRRTGPVAPAAAAAVARRPVAEAWLTRGLLYEWQQRNLSSSLPLALRQLERAGNLDNIRLAIQAGSAPDDASTSGSRPAWIGPVDPLPGIGYRGPVFMDSDIYKTLEAVGWELGARRPRPELGSPSPPTSPACSSRPSGRTAT